MQAPLHFDLDLTAAFRALPNKALPHHEPPAPLWKAAAPLAAQCMLEKLRAGLTLGTIHLEVDWHKIQVALIPKLNKPLTTPDALRPISLLPAFAKVLAQQLALTIRGNVEAAAATTPQYAYLQQRQTADALDRAFNHCRQVREDRKSTSLNLRHRKLGGAMPCARGGLTLSLDLQKPLIASRGTNSKPAVSGSVLRAESALLIGAPLSHVSQISCAGQLHQIPYSGQTLASGSQTVKQGSAAFRPPIPVPGAASSLPGGTLTCGTALFPACVC